MNDLHTQLSHNLKGENNYRKYCLQGVWEAVEYEGRDFMRLHLNASASSSNPSFFDVNYFPRGVTCPK